MAVQVTIRATDFLRGDETIVVGAEKLADAVLCALNDGATVTISMEGARGVSSSFFNVILKRVADQIGPAAANSLCFVFDSEATRMVYERSRTQLLKAVG